MNAQTITMEPEAAAAKLAACKRELLKRHSAEVREQFEQLKRGYEALEKGTPLINPLHAIRQAGWKESATYHSALPKMRLQGYRVGWPWKADQMGLRAMSLAAE